MTIIGSSDSTSSSPSSSSSPYLIDHLRFMQEQETHYRVRGDYLSTSDATVTPEDRRTMCSWCYQIVDTCCVDRAVACIGMSYLDRFMSTSSHRSTDALLSRTEYQLAAVSCLVIALKCRSGIEIGTSYVADTVCQGVYTEDELDAMEMEVLGALTWKLNGPSSHDFVDAIVGLLPPSCCSDGASSSLVLAARAHLEAAALDYSMAMHPSSALACAALLSSLKRPDVLRAFRTADLIAWTSNVASVKGNGFYRVFFEGLMDIARSRLSSSTSSASPPPPVLVDEKSFVDDTLSRSSQISTFSAIHGLEDEGVIDCYSLTSSMTSSSEFLDDDYTIDGPSHIDVLPIGS